MQSASIWLVASPLIIQYRYSIVDCDSIIKAFIAILQCVVVACIAQFLVIHFESVQQAKKKKKDKTGTTRSSGIFLLVSTLTINLITFYCNVLLLQWRKSLKYGWKFNPCISLSQRYPLWLYSVFCIIYFIVSILLWVSSNIYMRIVDNVDLGFSIITPEKNDHD